MSKQDVITVQTGCIALYAEIKQGASRRADRLVRNYSLSSTKGYFPKKTLVKGLKGKRGSNDAYLIPEGVEDYSYTKDGKGKKYLSEMGKSIDFLNNVQYNAIEHCSRRALYGQKH